MKTIKTLAAAFLSLNWLAQASVIHLDVTDNSGVTVDVDLKSEDLQSETPHIESNSNPRHRIGTQQAVTDQYDVTLPWEIHRGFLSDDSSYVKFSNIPFAEPPLGPLRFKAPVPPRKKSQDVNEGLEERVCPQYQVGWVPKALEFLECYGGALAQKPSCSLKDNWTTPIEPSDYPVFGTGFHPKANEDCLLLDVFVPKSVWENKAKKVPVVVWIYGGGYIYGWKSQAGGPEPLFQAAREQNQDIIYVAMNYRLGAFGWSNGANFRNEGGTPNAGLQDQRLALSWIQEYIGLFGGDKSSVTVMGQSAGGSSILHHLVAGAGAEQFKPNFTQAILQSPAFFPEGDPDLSDDVYAEFKVRIGAEDFEDLQQKSTADLQLINAIMTFYSQYGLFKFGPKVDEGYVPQLPGQLLLNDKYHKGILTILGHTSLDGLLFTPPWIRDDQTLGEYMRSLYPNTPDFVLDTMKKDSYYGISDAKSTPEILKINAVSDLLDDIAVSCNNNYLTNAILKNDSATLVWRYLFSAKPAIHGSDVYFTYYPTKDPPAFVIPKIAKFMQQKYVNFILNGNPNGGEDLEWPPYEEKASNYRSVMKFGDLLLGDFSSVITDPLKHYRCDLWQNAPFRAPEDEWMLEEQGRQNRFQQVMSSHLVEQEL